MMGQRASVDCPAAPRLTVLQSWYQGTILHDRRTRAITELVLVYLLTSLVVLGFGVAFAQTPVCISASCHCNALSVATQTIWLWLRSRSVLRELKLAGIQERLTTTGVQLHDDNGLDQIGGKLPRLLLLSRALDRLRS